MEAIIADFGTRGLVLRAVMLDRLGRTVWQQTPGETMTVLGELEETAELAHLAGGQVTPLTKAQIAELQIHFNVHW